MKNILAALAALLLPLIATAQGWTAEELSAANTARDIAQPTTEEREAIKYLNLARLYPRKFADLEVADYYGGERMGRPSMFSDNRLTLIAELYQLAPRPALTFSPRLQPEARCLANEQSRNGEAGHLRHNCTQTYGGECCGYGFANGREIILQLLIDDGIENLGHRANCLNAGFASVAIAIATHPQFHHVAVLDLDWGSQANASTLRYLRLADLDAAAQQRYYELMTRNIDPDLKAVRPSGTTMVRTETSTQTTTTDGLTTIVKTETRHHADSTRQVITTTTSIGLDGNSTTRKQVTLEH